MYMIIFKSVSLYKIEMINYVFVFVFKKDEKCFLLNLNNKREFFAFLFDKIQKNVQATTSSFDCHVCVAIGVL